MILVFVLLGSTLTSKALGSELQVSQYANLVLLRDPDGAWLDEALTESTGGDSTLGKR